MVALVLVGTAAGLAFAFPDRAREAASGLVASLTGLFAPSNPDPGLDMQKAGPVERIFRPTKEQRAAFEILPVATQVFRPHASNDLVLGAVGVLQFDVVAQRLEHEYGVDAELEPCSIHTARWLAGSDDELRKLVRRALGRALPRLEVDDSAVDVLVGHADGDARRALNLLEQTDTAAGAAGGPGAASATRHPAL